MDETQAAPEALAAAEENGMHIHRPKPLHGAREIAVEVGVIVVGVIIALLAEQAVQTLDWAHKVGVANAAMTQEIAVDDGPQIYQRAAMDRCLNDRLDAIEQGLQAGLDRPAMLGLIRRYQVPSAGYDTQQRDAVNTTGVAVHIPERQFSGWQMIYASIPAMDHIAAQEQRDLGQLNAVRPGLGPLSAVEADRILTSAEALRADEKVMFEALSWTLPKMYGAGLRLEPARLSRLMTWSRQRYAGCLSRVPPDWDGERPLPPENRVG